MCYFDQCLACYKHFVNVNHYDVVMNTTTSAINIIHVNIELAFSRNFQAVFSKTNSQLIMFQAKASKTKYAILVI